MLYCPLNRLTDLQCALLTSRAPHSPRRVLCSILYISSCTPLCLVFCYRLVCSLSTRLFAFDLSVCSQVICLLLTRLFALDSSVCSQVICLLSTLLLQLMRLAFEAYPGLARSPSESGLQLGRVSLVTKPSHSPSHDQVCSSRLSTRSRTLTFSTRPSHPCLGLPGPPSIFPPSCQPRRRPLLPVDLLDSSIDLHQGLDLTRALQSHHTASILSIPYAPSILSYPFTYL